MPTLRRRRLIRILSLLPLFLASTRLHAQENIPDPRPPAPQLLPVPTPDRPDLGESARKVIQLTNKVRGEHQQSALAINQTLEEAALGLAQFMAETGKFSHEADERTPTQRAEAEGYEPCLVAENIARVIRSEALGTAELAESFVESWIGSPEHRNNLLDAAATEIGVGIARSEENGQFFAVQLFGRPRSAMIGFSIVNRTDAEVSYTLGEATLSLAPNVTRTHGECRPQTLTFDSPAEQEPKAAPPTFQPESGQRFLIDRVGEELRVTVERQEPAKVEPTIPE